MYLSKYIYELILIILIRYTYSYEVRIGNYKEAKFDRFDGTCGGKKDILIIFNCDSIKVVDGMLFMNGSFNVKSDITFPTKLRLSLQRCKNKENLNTCENFHTFNINNFCQLASSGNQVWKPFLSCIEPKWECPLRKGTYTINNSKLDISAFLLFPLNVWFWKGRGEMLDRRTNKVIMCVIIETMVSVKPF